MLCWWIHQPQPSKQTCCCCWRASLDGAPGYDEPHAGTLPHVRCCAVHDRLQLCPCPLAPLLLPNVPVSSVERRRGGSSMGASAVLDAMAARLPAAVSLTAAAAAVLPLSPVLLCCSAAPRVSSPDPPVCSSVFCICTRYQNVGRLVHRASSGASTAQSTAGHARLRPHSKQQGRRWGRPLAAGGWAPLGGCWLPLCLMRRSLLLGPPFIPETSSLQPGARQAHTAPRPTCGSVLHVSAAWRG